LFVIGELIECRMMNKEAKLDEVNDE